jgi:hypothetical protein
LREDEDGRKDIGRIDIKATIHSYKDIIVRLVPKGNVDVATTPLFIL